MAPRSRPHTKHTTQHREAHVKFASKSRRRKRTHPRVGTQPPSRDTCVPMGPTPAACTTHTCRRGAPRPEGAPTSDSRLVCPQTRTPAARRNRGQTHASLSRGRPGRGWHAGALANDTRPSLIDVVCSGGSSAVSPKTSRGGATARAFCVGLWFSAGRGGLLGAVTCREQGWCRRTSRSASPSLTRESQCTWALRAPSLHARASLSRTAARRRALQARDLPSPRTEMAMGQRGIRAPGDSVGRRAARVQIAPLGTGQSWHATHSQSALLLSPHARQRDRRIEEREKFAHNHARMAART